MNTPLSSQADTTEPLRPPAPRRNPCERWITFFLIAGILWRLARFALHFPFRGDEAKLGLGMMERHFTDLNGAAALRAKWRRPVFS